MLRDSHGTETSSGMSKCPKNKGVCSHTLHNAQSFFLLPSGLHKHFNSSHFPLHLDKNVRTDMHCLIPLLSRLPILSSLQSVTITTSTLTFLFSYSDILRGAPSTHAASCSPPQGLVPSHSPDCCLCCGTKGSRAHRYRYCRETIQLEQGSEKRKLHATFRSYRNLLIKLFS